MLKIVNLTIFVSESESNVYQAVNGGGLNYS